MNDDLLQAIYVRDDPLPEGPAPAGRKRASLCLDVRDEEDVARLEQWMLANVDQLTCVNSTGCGCCVIGWDIEGPEDVIDTLPADLASAFDWPRDYSNSAPRASGFQRLVNWLRGF